RQEPHAAVSAACRHDAPDPCVRERRPELRTAAPIVSREIPDAAQQGRIPRHLVAAAEDPEAGTEGLTVQWSRGGDDGDAIARRGRMGLEEGRWSTGATGGGLLRTHAGHLPRLSYPRSPSPRLNRAPAPPVRSGAESPVPGGPTTCVRR